VEVKRGDKFEHGLEKPLFDARLAGSGYDVSNDGRFLIPVQTDPGGGIPLNLIVNWPALLKKGATDR
jgi:hypothetical protein